jgi:hypothetical protein
MAQTVVLDEVHLLIRIPATLPDPLVRTIRRTLTSRAFMTELRRAVAAVVSSRPTLRPVRVAVAR